MMKTLPKKIKVGHFDIEIKVLPTNISTEVCGEEGSFHARQRTIYLAEDIVEKGGADLICVLIHELMHAIYFQYGLSSSSSEEDVVNAMSNGVTELLTRTNLNTIINKILEK
jgi:hypothetical protein